jgi:hypothetical protein
MSWDTRRLFATRQAVKILVIEVHTLVLIILTHLKLLQVLDTKATPTQMGQLGLEFKPRFIQVVDTVMTTSLLQLELFQQVRV